MNPSICLYAENNSGVIMMSDAGFLGLGAHFQIHLYPSEQCVNLSLSFSLCVSTCRQFVFAAFTEEFISTPFTEQIFHFFIPALSDIRFSFPFEAFLSCLQANFRSSSAPRSQAPWVFYFVLSTGDSRLGGWHILRPSNAPVIPCECVCV